MIRRILNVATVLCILACIALASLWVRSHRIADRLHGRIWFPQSFLLASKEGHVAVIVLQWHGAKNWWRWRVVGYPVDDELSFPTGGAKQYASWLGFGWINNPLYMVMRSSFTRPDGTEVMLMGAATATLRGSGPLMPYWFLVFVSAALAGLLQWKKSWRFSLRSLLIGITLVSVALGLAIVLGR